MSPGNLGSLVCTVKISDSSFCRGTEDEITTAPSRKETDKEAMIDIDSSCESVNTFGVKTRWDSPLRFSRGDVENKEREIEEEKETQTDMVKRCSLLQQDSITDILMDTAEGLFLDLCRLDIPEIFLPEDKLEKSNEWFEYKVDDGLFCGTSKRFQPTLSYQLDTITETDDKDD